MRSRDVQGLAIFGCVRTIVRLQGRNAYFDRQMVDTLMAVLDGIEAVEATWQLAVSDDQRGSLFQPTVGR